MNPHSSFRHILLYCQAKADPAAALQRAVALAGQHRAQLTVTDVLPELPAARLAAVTTVSPAELQRLAVQERRQELERLAAPAAARGVQVGVKVLVGTPFLEIIRAVLRHRHDLVMKTAEGGRRALLFGSTDLHLLRKCPCPVWIGRPGSPPRLGRVLAAVAPEPGGEGRSTLNARVMALALALARLDGAELHVAHAWEVAGEDFLRSLRSPLSEADVDRLVGMVYDDQRRWLDGFLQPRLPRGLGHEKHLLRGDPGEVIPRLAAEQRIDLVVTGTVARTGIPSLIIGNTAERVLDQVGCSVLAVKPEGFVTPVTLQ